jgi:ABC-type multidrug transport system fused ATPase/permease subunit
MIRQAPILIMDEPTSGLDAESERLVFEGLARLSAGRTTFVIAHHLATVRDADCILVLEAGRIVERGTHDDLAARGGLYADLLATQTRTDPADTPVLTRETPHGVRS